MSSPPVLPADGNTAWGNGPGKWGTDTQARVAGNGAAADPTVRTLGTGANEAAPGNHTHSSSPASETVVGPVELATAAETTTGTDNTRAVHPAGLKVLADTKANRTLTINAQAGTAYTLAMSDANDVLVRMTGASPTVTFPSNATAAIPVGAYGQIRFAGTGQLTCAQGSGATLTSAGNAFKSATTGVLITWIKESTNGFAIDGYLTV